MQVRKYIHTKCDGSKIISYRSLYQKMILIQAKLQNGEVWQRSRMMATVWCFHVDGTMELSK